MSKYGRRYLTARDFESYCSDLNMDLISFNRELEIYEREGVLLPVARVIKPREYVLKRRQINQQPETYGQSLPEWDDLERLLYYYTDSDCWHPFDREFERQNEFLSRPEQREFRPWDSFYVEVETLSGDVLKVTSVEHYYHYWQVHQVFEIRSKYPIFAKHNWILQYLKDEAKDRAILKPRDSGPIATFYGKARYFDALSFYIELYNNEREKVFARVPVASGVKRLSDEEQDHFRRHLENHAAFVFQRYELSVEELYQFLVFVLDLRSRYQRREHNKLARVLENDAIYLARFLSGVTGESFSEVEKGIEKRATFWTKRAFRHLDKVLEVQDYAQDTFERLREEYNKQFPNFALSSTGVVELTRFIEETGLFIIPYAIFSTDRALNDPRAFRRASLFIGLSNLTTGLEGFLREVANAIPNGAVQTDTLYNLIRTVFSEWGQHFACEHQDRQQRASRDALWYITDVYTDPHLDNVLKTFLIAYRARNLVAHHFILDHDFYFDLYSYVYTAVCHALLYSWKHATWKGWLQSNNTNSD